MAAVAQEHTVDDARRKANARLAWVLATVALAFALGFVAKVWWLGGA
jgi:hypothetical protein